MVEKPHDDEKSGLKLQLNNILLRAMKALSGYYNDNIEDEKATELARFREAYNFRAPEIFAMARYKTIKNSLETPENLPIKKEIQKLRLFILSEMSTVVSNFVPEKITWLRSLVVSFLTLWNARRGEEGSRITLAEWSDAINGKWVPPDQVKAIEDEAEKALVGKFKLAYLHGKGRKFVPCLIPINTIEAVGLLVENRAAFGVHPDNPFVFATKGGKGHASGWHSLNQVATKADVKINATANRHFVSTVYAGLEMNPNEEQVFLDHMGHTKPINKENYQCPQRVKECDGQNTSEHKFRYTTK